MSTIPYNTPDATNAGRTTAVLPANGQGLDLDAVVSHFAATAVGLGASRPRVDDLTKMVSAVVALTTELFSAIPLVETNVDPELRDDVCLLFQVAATGGIDQIVARDKQWHLGVLAVAPQWPGLF